MAVINYTNEYSTLPSKLMKRHNFKNINSEMAAMVDNVKALLSSGNPDDYQHAVSLIEQYDLKSYILSAEYMNFIDEETRNLEIMNKAKKQSVYYMDDEPGFGTIGDIWIDSGEEN